MYKTHIIVLDIWAQMIKLMTQPFNII